MGIEAKGELQTPSITGTLLRLLSVISRKLVGGSYISAEVQSVYSTAPADWARLGMWRRNRISTPSSDPGQGCLLCFLQPMDKLFVF